MNKKRLLIIADALPLTTGYSCVANNIISNLLKTDKYIIGALGFSDIPVPIKYPIYYYSQLKDHAQCCNRGPIIEYVKPGDTKRSYLVPTIQGDCPPDHPNQNFCLKGQNIKNDHYGLDSSYFVIQHFKPDIVIPINDIWGLYHLNHLKNRSCYKFIPYLAIDSECLFPQLQPPESRPGLPVIDTIRTIGSTNGTIVFTDWARDVINKTCKLLTSGRELNNISIIPHGVDTSIWKPITEEERKEYRKKYFNIEPEKDNIFLLIQNSRNQPRKRQDATLMTIRKFIDKFEKPNKKLMCYFHCSLEDLIGWDLPWLASYYEIQDRIIFNKDLKPGIGPTNEELRKIIGCCDASIGLSNSEGWHLPIIEAMACGIPNIVTKYSAVGDWAQGNALFVDPAEYEHEPRTNFIKAIPSTLHAAKQIKLIYDSKEVWKDYSKRGITLAKKLEWINICKQWEEYIDNIDISDLKENRYSSPEALPEMKPQQPDYSQLQLKYLPNE